MLSLKIDGQPVDLPNDFSVTMNLKSPAFNEVGSYSYPFKIPNTPRNSIVLGFRHRIPSTNDPYSSNYGEFMWKQSRLFSGSVKMKLFNNSYFEGNIIDGNGDFNYSRKLDYLQDIDFGEIIFNNENEKISYVNSCAGKVYPDCNIVFPQILNKSYFDELPENNGLWYFNPYLPDNIPLVFSGSTQRTVIVPMLYLRYILSKVFLHIGYTFDDQFFTTHSDYNSLALFNVVDCNSAASGFFLYDIEKLLLNYHVPRMGLNDFFAGLESFFNIRFFVNNNIRKISLISVDSIIKNASYTDYSSRIISISHEPNDQIQGFRLGMQMETDDEFYNTKKELDEEMLSHLKNTVQSVADLNPWPRDAVGDLRYVLDENKYYRLWSNKIWIPWTENVDLFFEYIYRTQDQSIETKFSTLLNNNPGEPAVVGNSRKDWKSVSGKLFFTEHRTNDPVWKYVVALPSTNNNSLYFGGDNGLFAKYYKSFFDFRISTKKVKITRLMDQSELKDFDFSKKYMVNGTKYLVSSIQVTIKRDRIMPAVMECYPV